jgi:hypothetical protein
MFVTTLKLLGLDLLLRDKSGSNAEEKVVAAMELDRSGQAWDLCQGWDRQD